MRRCTIHFGMHKTGSSSIQATLFRNMDGVGFHFLDLGVNNPTGRIKNIFMPAEKRYEEITRFGGKLGFGAFLAGREANRNEFCLQLANNTAEHLIVSAEGLNYLSETELAELRDLIAACVDDIVAVAYIRTPKSFMESIFQQLVKGHLGCLDPGALYPRYRERFERFEKVFGADKVRYWKFDPKSFPEGCVVQDFCKRLDIPLQREKVVRINEGLSRHAVAFLFCYRKYARKFTVRKNVIRENRVLVEKLSELPGPKLRFATEIVKPIFNSNVDDILWMEERLGSPLIEDLVDDDAGAVHSETDLLKFDPGALLWLARQLGPEFESRCERTMDPEVVAEWIHRLRIKLAEDTIEEESVRRWGKSSELPIRELVSTARCVAPEVLANISDARAEALVIEALSRLGALIDQADEEIFKVVSLGHFRTRYVERELDGKKIVEKMVVCSLPRRSEL